MQGGVGHSTAMTAAAGYHSRRGGARRATGRDAALQRCSKGLDHPKGVSSLPHELPLEKEASRPPPSPAHPQRQSGPHPFERQHPWAAPLPPAAGRRHRRRRHQRPACRRRQQTPARRGRPPPAQPSAPASAPGRGRWQGMRGRGGWPNVALRCRSGSGSPALAPSRPPPPKASPPGTCRQYEGRCSACSSAASSRGGSNRPSSPSTLPGRGGGGGVRRQTRWVLAGAVTSGLSAHPPTPSLHTASSRVAHRRRRPWERSRRPPLPPHHTRNHPLAASPPPAAPTNLQSQRRWHMRLRQKAMVQRASRACGRGRVAWRGRCGWAEAPGGALLHHSKPP